MRSLYTYVPKENTVPTDGVLSTAFAPAGWEKYKERSGLDTREDVLKWLDNMDPGFKRSMAVTVLTEPIPDTAHPDMVAFAKAKTLVKLPAAMELIRRGLIKHQIHSIDVGGKGTHVVGDTMKQHIQWDKKKPGRFLFSNVPHYLLETTKGSIPGEIVVDKVLGKPEK